MYNFSAAGWLDKTYPQKTEILDERALLNVDLTWVWDKTLLQTQNFGARVYRNP